MKKKAGVKELDVVSQVLLRTLETVKPVGKKGTVKRVVAPWPDKLLELLSTEPTKVPVIKEITIQELFNIRTISTQRRLDDARMNKIRKYLMNVSSYCPESGCLFTAAEVNGEIILIDGNSRRASYYNELRRAIETNSVVRFAIPSTVSLLIHTVDNEKYAESLYYTCDSGGAVETGKNKMTGAMEAIEAGFKNPALDKANYKQGLLTIAAAIPGIKIDVVPSPEYGLFKEFIPELRIIEKHAKFPDKVLGGDDIAIVVGLLRKNRHSKRELTNIMEFANGVTSVTAEGSVINELGAKNGIALLHDEYFASMLNRRFRHRSTQRKQLFGLWVYYYNMWCDKGMSKSATSLSEVRLRDLADTFLKS